MSRIAFRVGQGLALTSALCLAGAWVWHAHTATVDEPPRVDDSLEPAQGTRATWHGVDAGPPRPPRVDKLEEDRQHRQRAGLLGALGDGAAVNVFGPGGLGGGNKSAMGGLTGGAGVGDAHGVGGLGSRGSGPLGTISAGADPLVHDVQVRVGTDASIEVTRLVTELLRARVGPCPASGGVLKVSVTGEGQAKRVEPKTAAACATELLLGLELPTYPRDYEVTVSWK